MSEISSATDYSVRCVSPSTKWVANRKPNDRAKIRIFCFPCAGAGASYFRNWHEKFLPEIDFLPIQLPGRENRFTEPLYENLVHLVCDLAEGLRPYMNMPFAFFGHSLGALVLYELTRNLRITHKPAPLQLFIAAYRAPHLSNSRPILHNMPDDDFINELIRYHGIPEEISENKEMLEVVTPIIKADYKIHETYTYKPEERLRCPIMVFGGIEDEFVDLNDLEGWRKETSEECQIRILSGGHYFINDNCEIIANATKENLLKSLPDVCEKLAGDPSALEIPTDHLRQGKKRRKAASLSFRLSLNLANQLKKVSREKNVTLFTTLLTGFKTLLFRYTNNEEIVIGIRASDCKGSEFEGMTGPLANTLFLCSDFSRNPSFSQMLGRARKKIPETQERQDLPCGKTLEKLAADRGGIFVSPMNILFALEEKNTLKQECTILTFGPIEFKDSVTKFDLKISITEGRNKLHGAVEYNTDLFDSATIERMTRHFQILLEGATKNPDLGISELPILSNNERHQLLVEWNETQKEYPVRMFHEMFDQQVELTPDATAVIFEDKRLSYRELNRRVNHMAHLLQGLGVRPEAPVGVYAIRSPNTMVALLAIFKAGGVYVPLDPSYPSEHIAYILQETEVSAIITEKGLGKQLPAGQTRLLYLDSESIHESRENLSSPEYKAEPNNLALIMYTSGSTGRPKGVAIEYRQLLNRFNWLWENYPFKVGEVTCQRTTVNFLPSVWELLGGLLKGIPTIILPDRIVKDPPTLIKTLSQHKVTRIAIVPSLLEMILDTDQNLQEELPELRLWFTAGEPLSLELYQRFRELIPQAILHNDYGATEVNGVICFDSRWQTEKFLVVPIGRPIANTQVYILDSHLQPVPVGMQGGLFIGGAPVARGYLNRPDLTDERFIPDPFSAEFGARLYNMGDIARYRPDGMIEVIGRRDHQVKILGKRVELGGIEKVLLQHPAVRSSAVVARNQGCGRKRLIAYVTLEQEERSIKDNLRSLLKRKLPDYMVPSDFIILQRMPLTPNGKVDRKFLSESSRYDQGHDGSQSVAQAALERIMSIDPRQDDHELRRQIKTALSLQLGKILDKRIYEIDEHMSFADQGLNSVDAVAWINTINREFNLHLSVTVIFDYFSIDKLSKYLVSRPAQENSKPSNSMNPFYGSHALNKKSEKKQTSNHHLFDIAVIGISGRFPGADNITHFWTNLKKGVDSITEVPAARWSIKEHFDPDPHKQNKSVSKWAGCLNDVDRFEPLFFNVSPEEAELMDPQQRICLEECWKALEDAGYAVNSIDARSVGVFMGVRSSGYLEKLKEKRIELDEHVLTGNDPAILAGRISHYLNLTGPSLSIDTACSSSLVATHLACRSLQFGECEMALAGGVSVLASENIFIMSSKAGMLSPRGECSTFDDRADGFVLAEGVGIVVLKALEKALKDRDNIYGVIKGSGTNHTGQSNTITVPGKDSQEALELDVYQKSGINPESIGYVEAHGTGTKLGDLIEVEALTSAFRKFTDKKQYCAIGSVKTNIGHANAAAGIIGLIKTLLCLGGKVLVPSLNFTKNNEYIEFKESPFYVNTKLQEWKSWGPYPRRAAINAFGYNGTNSHIVIEEAPIRISRPSSGSMLYYFIPFSAKTKAALYRRVVEFADWLKGKGGKYALGEIAYTLHMRRTHFRVRTAFVVENRQDLIEKIEVFLKTGHATLESSYHYDQGSSGVKAWLAALSWKDNCLKDKEYEEKLQALADLYVQNYDMDCEGLYNGQDVQCIFMPTYPFAGGQFWIPEVNRKNHLPAGKQERVKSVRPYMEPRSKVENKIAEVWKEVLKVERAGIHDSFMDLGGNSLLMLQAHKKLQAVFESDIAIVDMFFKYSTISALSKYFTQQINEEFSYKESQVRVEMRKRTIEAQREIRLRNRRRKRRT